MDYQELLDGIYRDVQDMQLKGRVASYIPELGHVDPNHFGISLVTATGKMYHVGNSHTKFSIQSISKVLTLAMVFPEVEDNLWSRVGVEPSGSSFNSLAQLEWENGIPRNPLINAGALVITDILRNLYPNPLNELLGFIKNVSGNADVTVNKKIAQSELNHSSRNKALAHFMKSFGNINSRVDQLIETYCYQCSIEMTATALAKTFLLFANHGKNIYKKKKLLSVSQTKRINAIMQTCGFYDEAGEFAFSVGLPGKSGVGGGIAAVLPEKFSIVVYSPELNKKGNSLKGMKALELLTTRLGHSIF